MNDKLNDGVKRNAVFQATSGIREAITLALGKTIPITYEQALDMVYDLSPLHYSKYIELLSNRNESDEVKYFKEWAEAESTPMYIVSPVDLIDQEMKKLDKIIAKAPKDHNLKLRRGKLIAAKEYFSPRKISEHKLLTNDFFLASRPFFKEAIYENDSYKDYKIDEGQYLRLRLLHPDKEEAILGADMIYEQFDLEKNRVRFIHLQYKVWDNNAIYFSDQRMNNQILRVENHLCNAGYCLGRHGKKYTTRFRLPYCSGFLRPTSNKASADSKMISTGDHLPICELRKLAKNSNKITRELIKDKSISHQIFDEGFISNKLGSRWIKMSELDKFYEESGILNFGSDTIRVHAQEVIIPSEAVLNKER